MRPSSEISLTTLEQYALLAVVALQPGAYTSAIGEHIGRHAGRTPLRGSLWVTLPGLARKRFVQSNQGLPTLVPGGRAKLFWSITPKGQRALVGSLKVVGRLSRAANLHVALG